MSCTIRFCTKCVFERDIWTELAPDCHVNNEQKLDETGTIRYALTCVRKYDRFSCVHFWFLIAFDFLYESDKNQISFEYQQCKSFEFLMVRESTYVCSHCITQIRSISHDDLLTGQRRVRQIGCSWERSKAANSRTLFVCRIHTNFFLNIMPIALFKLRFIILFSRIINECTPHNNFVFAYSSMNNNLSVFECLYSTCPA